MFRQFIELFGQQKLNNIKQFYKDISPCDKIETQK